MSPIALSFTSPFHTHATQIVCSLLFPFEEFHTLSTQSVSPIFLLELTPLRLPCWQACNSSLPFIHPQVEHRIWRNATRPFHLSLPLRPSIHSGGLFLVRSTPPFPRASAYSRKATNRSFCSSVSLEYHLRKALPRHLRLAIYYKFGNTPRRL